MGRIGSESGVGDSRRAAISRHFQFRQGNREQREKGGRPSCLPETLTLCVWSALREPSGQVSFLACSLRDSLVPAVNAARSEVPRPG